jgi:hypothetical protein
MSALIYSERALAGILGLSRDDLRYIRQEVLEKKEGWRMEGREAVITAAGLKKVLGHLKASSNAPADDLDFSTALIGRPDPAEKKEEGGGSNGAPPVAHGDALAATDSPADPSSQDRPAIAPEKPALVKLTVRKCWPNYKLLEAATPAGELVTVRVNNNKNFRPNMTLQARLSAAGKYEMEGRCPRSPGRY